MPLHRHVAVVGGDEDTRIETGLGERRPHRLELLVEAAHHLADTWVRDTKRVHVLVRVRRVNIRVGRLARLVASAHVREDLIARLAVLVHSEPHRALGAKVLGRLGNVAGERLNRAAANADRLRHAAADVGSALVHRGGRRAELAAVPDGELGPIVGVHEEHLAA